MNIYRLILIHLSLSNWAIWDTVINNELADIYFHVGYLSWVIYLCSALCTLKPKKPKNLKKFPKKPRFFPALDSALVHEGYHLVKRKKESFRNVCVRTRWRCGEIWFPHSALFRCVALTTARGAYCDKLYHCIVGWLVVGSPFRELWLMVYRRPLVTIEH